MLAAACCTAHATDMQGGRICLAVPASGDMSSRGMLLGSSPGGGMMYIEPASCVPINNELAAARGKAKAAEEAVLWRLTGGIADEMANIEACYHLVSTISLWFSLLDRF